MPTMSSSIRMYHVALIHGSDIENKLPFGPVLKISFSGESPYILDWYNTD